MKRKGKVRFGALGALAAKLGSLALVVVSDPTVLATVTGKLGVAGVFVTAVVQAITKPVVRKDYERTP